MSTSENTRPDDDGTDETTTQVTLAEIDASPHAGAAALVECCVPGCDDEIPRNKQPTHIADEHDASDVLGGDGR